MWDARIGDEDGEACVVDMETIAAVSASEIGFNRYGHACAPSHEGFLIPSCNFGIFGLQMSRLRVPFSSSVFAIRTSPAHKNPQDTRT